MKNLLTAVLAVFFAAIIITSCTKMDLNNPAATTQNLNSKNVNPNVLQCGSGYHWDYYWKKCIVNCPTGYHNDSITGACVIDGNGGGGTQNITVVTNPNNPEEIIGQDHNLGMDAIMPNYSNGDLEPTEQNVLSYTKTFLLSKGYDTATFTYAYNYDKQHFGANIIQQNNLLSLASQMYSQGLISLTAKNYLIQLVNSFTTFAGDSISIPTQSSYNSFANSLITYETQFSNNSNLTSNDKYILFSAYSVARYSAVYSVNYAIQMDQGVIVEMQSYQTNSLTGWFHWGRVVGGDVVGAASGALGGGAAALATGGALSPAIIGGAVGVGVGSSVYEAGMQVWNHFWGSN